ncbi:MAG TPA: hypothetical protein VEI04_02315 [Syntrophobacteria bacterium]|nr:hypothetical protein [Syntrophobacteria bacterium]
MAIHPTAITRFSAKVGDGVEVGSYAMVGEEAKNCGRQTMRGVQPDSPFSCAEERFEEGDGDARDEH